MVLPLKTRVVAEALGTGLLVCTVVGSGIMAERLAGGNQAVALLGNTIPTGAILIVVITILVPVVGGPLQSCCDGGVGDSRQAPTIRNYPLRRGAMWGWGPGHNTRPSHL
jgi:hypothetical protein